MKNILIESDYVLCPPLSTTFHQKWNGPFKEIYNVAEMMKYDIACFDFDNSFRLVKTISYLSSNRYSELDYQQI